MQGTPALQWPMNKRAAVTGGSVFDEDASRKLEAAYQTPDVIAQRQQTLRALALRPGERVLDIGAGPGLLVAEMAQEVGPTGHVTGLEISDSMVALGRARCADPAVWERVSFVKADAVALPFRDEAFDAAVSTQVYEYVADLDAALVELNRVLDIGGRTLILDTDWDSIVWNATDQARMYRLLAAWTERFADVHLPRSLARQLQDAGFRVDRRQVLVLFNPSTIQHLQRRQRPDHGRLRRRSAPHDACRGRGVDGRPPTALPRSRYLFSLNRYLFTATKQR